MRLVAVLFAQLAVSMSTMPPEIVLPCDDSNCTQIQIASDLHLDRMAGMRKPGDLDALIKPSAPVLALLGDIGSPTREIYKEFLLLQAARFKAVLVLSGNHEYYSPSHSKRERREGQGWRAAKAESQLRKTSVEDVADTISHICAEHPALHYVDNQVVRLGTSSTAPALLCTPLWSHVPAESMAELGGQHGLNDYSQCFVRTGRPALPAATNGVCDAHGKHSLRQLTPADTSRWHAQAVLWLQQEIARLRSAGVPSIGALTHHTPSMMGTSHPMFEGANASPIQHGFSTDLAAVYENTPELKLWAYGHTHYNNDRVVSGTRLVSNQRGYKDLREDTGIDYRADLCVSFG
jgi:hypothetical protein